MGQKNKKMRTKKNSLKKKENRIILLKAIISFVLALLLLLFYDLWQLDPSNVLNVLLAVLLAVTLLFFTGLGIATLLTLPSILREIKKGEEK